MGLSDHLKRLQRRDDRGARHRRGDHRDYMGSHDAPSTLLGVAVLGYDNQLVEVEAVAVLPTATT
ncbi:hypothetical protein [Actinomadura miaoliensis]|uniref:RidA family protein n=1 Tax=Actinomadura miaoliensis TaxID=430685 RepID=A0ABP7WDC8_9ACTN